MTANDRNAECAGSVFQAPDNRRCAVPTVGPERIDDGERPPAHSGDIRDVDHYAAPAGKPRIARAEFVHKTFDCKERITVAVRDGRTIVADGHRLVCGYFQATRHGCDISLGCQALAVAKPLRKPLDRVRHLFQPAIFGRDKKPISGVAKGGYWSRSAS